MSNRPPRIDLLFADAISQPPAERGAFLAKACGANVDLLAHLVALVAAHEGPESLLESAAANGFNILPNETAGNVIGRYKLLQKIGEGGCGVVWMAEQEEPVRRRVALKIIKLGMDTKSVVARFEAERQALAMMDHANIAKVHDAGATETGRPFFVMELVRGIPITKYCDENHLTPTARLELFIKVCQAVQHAHQKGIIHRDLKPSNILVTVNDGAPTPKIIDFGIAKATQGRLTDATVFTQFEQFIGTPAYMSPEQAEMSSLDIDTRSDIYSLGVLLYELLAGRPPFDPKKFAQAGVDQIRQQIREVEPPRPSARLSTLDDDERTTIARLRNTASSELSIILRGDLDWIVMRCIEKDRTRRYDTANVLAMDIQRYLRNEPVVARPPSTAYLLQKLIRRHRFGFAAGVAIFGVVSIGLVVSMWLAIRATRAEREQSVLRAAAQSAQANEAAQRRAAEAQELIARQRAYAADMQLVQQALAGDNLVRAAELLHRQKPSPGQRDLRDWEWRYLWQFCRTDATAEFCRVSSSIKGLSVSADGLWLAVSGGQPSATVWNVATRQSTAVPVRGERTLVAFAPRGPILAASSLDRVVGSEGARYRVVIWNVETRQTIREFPLGAQCAGVAFSADGQVLITSTVSPENQVTLWRLSDGGVIRTIEVPRHGSYEGTSFAVTPELGLCAHGARNQQLRVVDLNTGRERWSKEGAAEGNVVNSVAFSADSRLLASGAGYDDPLIRVWDVASGKLIRTLEGHHNWVAALMFWPDGKTLASAGSDRTIRIWDVASGRLLNTLRGHKLEAWRLAMLPDNATLISGGKDGSVLLWNALSRPDEVARTQLPVPVTAWRFAADSKSIMTVSSDGRVMRWHGSGFRDARTELELGALGASSTAFPLLPEISPDLRFIAAKRNSAAREVEVWDTSTRTLRYRFTAAGNVSPAAVFQNNHTLRVFDERDAGTILCREWDLNSGRTTRTWRMPTAGSGSLGVTFSSDGRHCILRAPSSKAVVYDLQSGGNSPVEQMPANRYPRYSPDGNLLAISWMGSHEVKLRETTTYREVATLSAMMRVPHSVGFSADGARLAVGAAGREAVVLWNVETHEPVLTLQGSGPVFLTTMFSPDGNILGSRSTLVPHYDGILHLWRAPSREEIEAKEKLAATQQPRP